MDNRIIVRAVLLLLAAAGTCWAGCCTESTEPPCRERVNPDTVEKILEQLRQTTEKLQSYQAHVEYLVKQPFPFESETLKKGVLYYATFGKESRLRINFQTLKQDDEKPQKYVEQYIFDGVWLTKIDHQIKTVERHPLVDPNELKDTNEPKDVFELVSRNFPIVGFSKAENLKKEFQIKLVEEKESESTQFIRLHLKVKPDSAYKDSYTSIDFWIDKESYLPAKIVAVSTEEDTYETKLLEPKTNKKIDKKVFDFKVPRGFSIEEYPPKKKSKD